MIWEKEVESLEGLEGSALKRAKKIKVGIETELEDGIDYHVSQYGQE